MDIATIQRKTDNIPISLNMACKILHKGKQTVRGLIGTKIRLVEDVKSNSYGLNLKDVLELV